MMVGLTAESVLKLSTHVFTVERLRCKVLHPWKCLTNWNNCTVMRYIFTELLLPYMVVGLTAECVQVYWSLSSHAFKSEWLCCEVSLNLSVEVLEHLKQLELVLQYMVLGLTTVVLVYRLLQMAYLLMHAKVSDYAVNIIPLGLNPRKYFSD